ncbi:outer membrane beta-barrel protein [Acidisoma cellulosilytica]|uniref:Outer membrane beta-barrel protein n=1 Tax=Acidisoma cellulosilyticum TaxID=2802395 RepID=A0A964E3N6_9PROT|nr:OmpW family outer membrane protein [Acidisoma cellulosilyticum]MCB8880619.1 outer membrane beta-barrel protein [Acidisoma cellulosilyticum]
MTFPSLIRALATIGLALTLPLAAARAQTAAPTDDLVAGSVLVRGRIEGVLLKHNGTTISRIGGYLDNSDSVTPEIDLSYFFTDHIAIEGETGLLHTTLTAKDTRLGNVSIGKVSSVPIFLVPQYHFLPNSRFNPYLGVGVAILPYFNAEAAGGLVRQLSVSNEVGTVFQLGIDYRVAGPWYANFDVKKLILSAHATANNGALSASGQVNPWIIGAGIGYRF